MRKLPGPPGVEHEYVLTERDLRVIGSLLARVPDSAVVVSGERSAIVAKVRAWVAELDALDAAHSEVRWAVTDDSDDVVAARLRRVRVEPHLTRWKVYVDGKLCRGPTGHPRFFRSRAAAEGFGLYEAWKRDQADSDETSP